METILRRNRLDLMTPSELAIFNAIQEVEKIGASIELTEVVNLLQKSRDLVADFIELDRPDYRAYTDLKFIECVDCGYICQENDLINKTGKHSKDEVVCCPKCGSKAFK